MNQTRLPNLSAIILAGGQSSRMGRDKALMPVEGVPLLRRVYDVAQQCADAVYVVTPWGDRYRSMLPPSCQFVLEVPLANDTGSQGPLVGFAQGLASVHTDWVLLLACDMPLLQASVLQHWASQLERVQESAIAFLPKHTKGWEPLCGFYRRRCLPDLQQCIEQGGRSFQRWLAQTVVQELPLEDRQMLLNCNTPQDLTY